jgi:hypothetical protein
VCSIHTGSTTSRRSPRKSLTVGKFPAAIERGRVTSGAPQRIHWMAVWPWLPKSLRTSPPCAHTLYFREPFMKAPTAFIAAAAFLGSTTLVMAFYAPATPGISSVQLAQAKMDDKTKKDDMMKDDKMAKDKMDKDKMSKDDKMMKDDKMKK